VKEMTDFVNEYSLLVIVSDYCSSVFALLTHLQPWWHAELKSRSDAEAFLEKKSIGEFVLRSSTQENAIALSHKEKSGVVGHCLLRMHFATSVSAAKEINNVGRWSIEVCMCTSAYL
jgi:hypothetical protein